MPEQRHGRDALQLLCGSLAVIAGCLLLASLGAPSRMILINFAALLIGLSLLAILRLLTRAGVPASSADWSLLALALTVPATGLFGQGLDGVSRWVVVAGLTLQPAMIAVPAILAALAARPTRTRAAAATVAAAGVAFQPDPAAAMMLFLGAAALVAQPQSRPRQIRVAVIAGAALLVAWLRSPLLAPVPFVEGLATQALSSGLVPTMLMLLGSVALLLPALLAPRSNRAAALSFGAVWTGALIASLGGQYPTPVLGFGGSAILGYVLSLGFLMRGAAAATPASAALRGRSADEESESGLRYA